MTTKDITKKITRIFFSFLFVFLVSFFVLPIDDVSACTLDDPGLTWVSASTQNAIEGDELTYTLKIENKNTDGDCTIAENTFSIIYTKPAPIAEFNFTLAPVGPFVIAEGATQNFTFKLQSTVNGGLIAIGYGFVVEVENNSNSIFDKSANGVYNITELLCDMKDPGLILNDVLGDTGAQGETLSYNFSIKNNDSNDILCGNLPRTFEVKFALTPGMRDCPSDWKHDFCDPADPVPGTCTDYSTVPLFNYITPAIGSQNNRVENFTLTSCSSAPLATYPFTITVVDTVFPASFSSMSEQYIVDSVGTEICNGTGNDDGDAFVADCDDPDCVGSAFCCGNGNIDSIETCDASATPIGCLGSETCVGCSSCVNLFMEGGCPINYDDCDCDSTTGINGCETDLLNDSSNCGTCGKDCLWGCVNGMCVEPKGGLVPCGRVVDNPDTIWNETESCKICHAVPLIDSIIDYLVGIVGLLTVLSIIIAGLMSVTSAGGPAGLGLAKSAAEKSLYGFVFILVAWAIVNVGMVIFGFSDPSGDGDWAKFNCDLNTIPEDRSYCGDSIVQETGNGDGLIETCERKESKLNYFARTGTASEVAWVNSVYSCNPATCDVGCVSDIVSFPVFTDIGLGCYLDTHGTPAVHENDECQKGKYVCDETTDTVQCRDVFSDEDFKVAGFSCSPEFDYCCDGNWAAFAALSFDVVRGTPGNFRCDDVCKNLGKICVGVGLHNPAVAACVKTVHNAGSCQNLVNLASSNCNATFTLGSGFCLDTSMAPFWSMGRGDTDCYCR